jgi:hypothetical protein
MEKDIFISYSSLDKDFVEKLAKGLQSREIKVWFDRWEIKPGQNIVNEINKALQNSKFLLVVLTESSLQSKWVEEEWTKKFGEEVQKNRVTVIPTIIGNVEENDIPIILRGKNRINLSVDYEKEFSRLTDYLLEEKKEEAMGEIRPLAKEILIKQFQSAMDFNLVLKVMETILEKLELAKDWSADKKINLILNELNYALAELQNEATETNQTFRKNPSLMDFALMNKRIDSEFLLTKLRKKINFIGANNKDTETAFDEIVLELNYALSEEQKRESARNESQQQNQK